MSGTHDIRFEIEEALVARANVGGPPDVTDGFYRTVNVWSAGTGIGLSEMNGNRPTVGGYVIEIGGAPSYFRALDVFNQVVAGHRDRFIPDRTHPSRAFGSILVPYPRGHGWLTTPREKTKHFTESVTVPIINWNQRIVYVVGGTKATLNAPLLVRMLGRFPKAVAIVHLHEILPDVPTVPWAQPGSSADNDREIPGPTFNIEGHGFVICLFRKEETAPRGVWVQIG